MPPGTPLSLTANMDDTGGTSRTTASVTPKSGHVHLCCVITAEATAASTPTVSGAGLTWTQIAQSTFAGGLVKVTLFEGRGTPTSGQLTLSCGANNQTWWGWSVVDVPASWKTRNVANNSQALGTSLTVTLAALRSANSMCIGFAVVQDFGISQGTGFTQLTENANSNASLDVEYKANDTTVDWSWTNLAQAGAVAVEVIAGAPQVGMIPIPT